MDLRSTEAQLLREKVQETKVRFLSAQQQYEHALAIAVDTQFSSDGATGLRTASRNYASALKEYSGAVKDLADFVLER